MQLESSVTLFDDNKVESKFAQLEITADGITSEVSRKVGNDEVISRINQSAEGIQIQANKVNIEGATIFSSGRLSQSNLNNAYDSKGSASTSVNNLKNDLSASSGTTVIHGGHITTGTLNANAVNANSGTFNTANIPDLSAGKITSGTIASERIVSIGPSSGAHSRVTANGLDVYGNDGETVIAAFGATSTIGPVINKSSRIHIDTSYVDIINRDSLGTDSIMRIGVENANTMRIGDPYYSTYVRLEKTSANPRADLHVVDANSASYTNVGLYKNRIELTGGAGSITNSFTALKAEFTTSGCTLSSEGSLTLGGTYNKLYKITTVALNISALNANSYVSAADITMTAQSGYNAVGIVGWATNNWRIRPTTHYVKSNTALNAGACNATGENVTTITITFYVLWLKATAG